MTDTLLAFVDRKTEELWRSLKQQIAQLQTALDSQAATAVDWIARKKTQ